MAVPLRKAAGGFDTYPDPQPGKRNAGPGSARAAAPKRLVRRQIRSNAEFRRAIAWVSLGMSAFLFSMAILSIFVKAGVSQVNYDINMIRRENEQILLDNERTRSQIAELRSLDRIEAIATQDLGMVKNVHVDYMVLSTTIVAEGKIRPVDETVEEKPESIGMLDQAISFIQRLLGK